MAEENNEVYSNQMLSDKKEVKCNKMREALAAIAQEVLLLHDTNNIASSANDKEVIFNKLIKSKYSLVYKKKVIRKLKEKVKTAYTVAHAAISAEKNKNTSLNGHFHLAKDEYEDLYQRHKQTSQIIQTMTKDNKFLRGELDIFFKLVELGYKDLHRLNNEYVDETSIIQKLKQIIVCCGQNSAAFNNEKEKNLQLIQKNSFLNNKISILNNSLEAISEDLRNLRRQNARLQNENNYLREKNEKLTPKYVVPIPSEYQNQYQVNLNMMRTKLDVGKNPDFDVTVHLSIIKKLLRDQDDLLRDLKFLSKEIITQEQDISNQENEDNKTATTENQA